MVTVAKFSDFLKFRETSDFLIKKGFVFNLQKVLFFKFAKNYFLIYRKLCLRNF
jgi:hypothetical protein